MHHHKSMPYPQYVQTHRLWHYHKLLHYQKSNIHLFETDSFQIELIHQNHPKALISLAILINYLEILFIITSHLSFLL